MVNLLYNKDMSSTRLELSSFCTGKLLYVPVFLGQPLSLSPDISILYIDIYFYFMPVANEPIIQVMYLMKFLARQSAG